MCEDAFENVIVCIKQIPFVSGIKARRSVHTYFHYLCDLSGYVHSEVYATSWVELSVVHVWGILISLHTQRGPFEHIHSEPDNKVSYEP